MTATCERSNHKKRAGEDMRLSTRDDADKAVRRAIEALAALGDLERLHPIDLARVGAAAATFTREIHAITRRRSPRGRRGAQRGRRQPAGSNNPEGTA